jgi:hypothetical protein
MMRVAVVASLVFALLAAPLAAEAQATARIPRGGSLSPSGGAG